MIEPNVLKSEDFAGLTTTSPPVAPRLPEKSCGNCEHFAIARKQCHRHPPQVMLVYSDPENPRNLEKTVWTSTWPNTTPEMRCGEFTPRAQLPSVDL